MKKPQKTIFEVSRTLRRVLCKFPQFAFKGKRKQDLEFDHLFFESSETENNPEER